MVLNGLLDVSCAAELQFNEPFSQQLVELFKHSATTGMLGPVHDRHTSVLEGNTNKAAGIFWNGCITARNKIEQKQDTRLKASQDTDIVKRCRKALSCWNEKVMGVCLCAGWGLGGAGAAVSNGSCLTGKRSICYNVNNDPSSYCAAWDKSIKDPSRPIITILCQQPAEGMRVTEREKRLRKWGRILETAISLELLCRIVVLIVDRNVGSQSLASHSFLSALFFLARTCWLFAMVDLQLNGICLGVEWSPCCCIDYPLTKRYWQTHSDTSEIISEMVFLATKFTRGWCLSKSIP